jgi:hypothetical protein
VAFGELPVFGYKLPWPIIGLTGKAGSGKDTAATLLQAQTGALRYALATPLKEALNAIFRWPAHYWDDREWKEAEIPGLGKSPRQMAQTLGTEWGRGCVNPGLWLHIAEQRISRLQENSRWPVIITDIRFANEARFIQQRGGVVVEIIRPDVGEVSTHISEARDFAVDMEVRNDMTLPVFGKRLRNCLLVKYGQEAAL